MMYFPSRTLVALRELQSVRDNDISCVMSLLVENPLSVVARVLSSDVL